MGEAAAQALADELGRAVGVARFRRQVDGDRLVAELAVAAHHVVGAGVDHALDAGQGGGVEDVAEGVEVGPDEPFPRAVLAGVGGQVDDGVDALEQADPRLVPIGEVGRDDLGVVVGVGVDEQEVVGVAPGGAELLAEVAARPRDEDRADLVVEVVVVGVLGINQAVFGGVVDRQLGPGARGLGLFGTVDVGRAGSCDRSSQGVAQRTRAPRIRRAMGSHQRPSVAVLHISPEARATAARAGSSGMTRMSAIESDSSVSGNPRVTCFQDCRRPGFIERESQAGAVGHGAFPRAHRGAAGQQALGVARLDLQRADLADLFEPPAGVGPGLAAVAADPDAVARAGGDRLAVRGEANGVNLDGQARHARPRRAQVGAGPQARPGNGGVGGAGMGRDEANGRRSRPHLGQGKIHRGPAERLRRGGAQGGGGRRRATADLGGEVPRAADDPVLHPLARARAWGASAPVGRPNGRRNRPSGRAVATTISLPSQKRQRRGPTRAGGQGNRPPVDAVVATFPDLRRAIQRHEQAAAGRRQADDRPALQAVEDRPARAAEPAVNALRRSRCKA